MDFTDSTLQIHLDHLDNLEQLAYLYSELPHLHEPPAEWYESRIRIVEQYTRLNLSSLAERFATRDPYLHDTAQLVFAFAAELTDQWAILPSFDLRVYSALIQNLYEMIHYYHQHYDQDEEAVEDLADMMQDL